MFSAVVRAQTMVRKAYPSPKVTPQVQRIRSTMRSMRLDTEGVTLPEAVDNSKNKYFPPIINQDGGSCA